jgi:UDP-N-acetyl-D-galactosamine dehydrogenase
VTVHDPLADPAEAKREYGLELQGGEPAGRHDLVIAAVPHRAYREMADAAIAALAAPGGLIADLKGIWRARDFGHAERWTL